MTKDGLKNKYSMFEIISQYGFHPNRAGFISCPFHKGDRTPSMKIYKTDYHCHACGANGDIFSFIQEMDHCDFKTAFYSLGGTYEKPSSASRMAVYHIRKAKESRKIREDKVKRKMQLNNMLLGIYVTWLKRLEPMSDAWCDCMNAYTYCLYRDEKLQKEMKGSDKA